MRIRTRYLTPCLLVLGLTIVSPPARASLITVGGTATPTAYSDPTAAMNILDDTGLKSFSESLNGDSISGTGEALVVSGYKDNPFGLNSLTFIYQVSLTGGLTPNNGPPILERLSMGSFEGVSTDVGYNAAAGEVIPGTRSATRSTNSGETIGFEFFPTSILLGQTSAILIINTNATEWVPGTLTVQDSLTANLPGFAPVSGSAPPVVPEPATMLSILSALPALGVWQFLRRRGARQA